MEIIIDEKTIYKSKSGNYTGVIYFHMDDYNFPEKNWNDFLITIVRCWIYAFLNAGEKDKIEFVFMDGPYSVIFQPCENNLYQVELNGYETITLSKKVLRYEIQIMLNTTIEQIIDVIKDEDDTNILKELIELQRHLKF